MFNITFLLVAGYFSPQDNFAPYLIPLKYLSPCKWIYQMLLENEFTGANITCMNPPENCNPLQSLNFVESMQVSFAALASLALLYLE